MSWKHKKFKSTVAKCREKGTNTHSRKCSVHLPSSSTVYCGEALRDEIMKDHNDFQIRVCDCVVCIEYNKISLVELKRRVPKNNVREQFDGGITILKHILPRKTLFSLQVLLVTKHKVKSHSETRILQKPITDISPRVSIKQIDCECYLPDEYVSNCRLLNQA